MAITLGDRLGPYEVLARVGEGGMGEVWKARDSRLNRLVAIKQVKVAKDARFEQEARAIAAINHPHVCQIFDIGPDYLVLEYVEGAPLEGPQPIEKAASLAIQIAGALEAAHRKGILHRDLKPANVIVTESGAKVLDFGLAKLAPDGDAAATQTADGVILGTPAYMSPEQAQGKPLDIRSDIFSFGVVLYELISGRRAFGRNSMAASMYAVLREDPPPLEAPAFLRNVVVRCLAKDPVARFASMSEVRVALEQRDAAPPPASRSVTSSELQPSIAVLPFVNMSPDRDGDYFSDGLAEDILSLLAKVPGLSVTSRTSSFAFRGKDQEITRIAETLHVRTILEGSVRRSGSRIRVSAQLINAVDGFHIWSERFDRELTDIFEVQDEISAAIAGALKIKLSGDSAKLRTYQPNVQAYEAFLKARYHLQRFSPDSYKRAKEYLEEAIALDPGYAAPHAELAMCYLILGFNGIRPPLEVAPLVREEAGKALALDPADPTALAACCGVASYCDFDWANGERYFREMLAAGSVPPEVLARTVLYNLVPRGLFDEACAHIESILKPDPLNVQFRSIFSVVLVHAGRWEQALEAARKAAEIDPKFWMSHLTESLVWWVKGDLDKALRSAEAGIAQAPWHAPGCAHLAAILELCGQADRAREYWPRPCGNAAFAAMQYNAIRGDVDAALDSYTQSIELREPFAAMFASSAAFGRLHESPRWPAIARRMGLPAKA